MINVALVSGGYSGEYVISLQSGEFIYKHLDSQKYQIYRVHILKEGWYAVEGNNKYPIDKSDFSFEKNGEKIQFEVVYNTIHGTPGEDGHMQAYFELIGLPYCGARYYQSALTFNKRDTLSVLDKFGIKKAKSIYISKGDSIDFEVVKESLGVPFFVKPNQSGSSLGISKVYKEEEFEKALRLAFQEDNEILIESEIKGDEISVGVLKIGEVVRAVGTTQIIPENDYFDYEAKYEGKSKELTPANIPYEMQQVCMKTAQNIYSVLGLSGIARIDFIFQGVTPYFLEVNTCPGMSPASIFPQQVEASDYSMSEILDNEIQIALEQKPIWDKE